MTRKIGDVRVLDEEPKSPGLRDDDFGVEHIYKSWDEWFVDGQKLIDMGLPPEMVTPDVAAVARLGPMPKPPWVADEAQESGR